MLAIRQDFKPDPPPAFRNYARTLRAMGQDLAGFFPDELEIVASDNQFVVTGVGMTQASSGRTNNDGAVRRMWNRFNSRQSKGRTTSAPLHHEPITRQYSPDDIDRLVEIGQLSRGTRDGKPDIYSLGERLRTVGRIVDSCGGALSKIVKARNSIILEYRDQQGNDRREEYTNLALYKYQQRYYAERGFAIVIDPSDSAID